MPNQDPEQLARDLIDQQLLDCGWFVQDKDKMNFSEELGGVVRYCPQALKLNH